MHPRRSLRRHALLIALAVTLSPLLLVVSTNWLEALFGDRTREHAEETVATVAETLRSGLAPARETAADRAARWNQRVRVVDAESGAVLIDANRLTDRSVRVLLGDLFYGPERNTVLSTLDRELGPLLQRPEVTAKWSGTLTTECRFITAGNLFLCGSGAKVTLTDGRRLIVHVESWSRRALQALYESRRQLVKLFLFSAALALFLAWWTIRSFVQPVEALRDDLLSRANEAVPKSVTIRDARTMGALEVADLTRAFNAVLAALAERTRTNEAFLADLAHEFKNPVAAVRACSEQMSSPGPLDEARKARLAQVLDQSSTRLDALVTQFLELARAEAGLPNEAREPVDLAAQVRGLIAAMAADPRFERVSFQHDVPERPLRVEGVAHRLGTALQNLLINAASFAGDGGWVRVGIEVRGDTAAIRISDSGPGIPAEHLPHLFDRFFSRRGDRHGTGLGLALVRAIVEAHGGSVTVASGRDEGATFTVKLPVT